MMKYRKSMFYSVFVRRTFSQPLEPALLLTVLMIWLGLLVENTFASNVLQTAVHL